MFVVGRAPKDGSLSPFVTPRGDVTRVTVRGNARVVFLNNVPMRRRGAALPQGRQRERLDDVTFDESSATCSGKRNAGMRHRKRTGRSLRALTSGVDQILPDLTEDSQLPVNICRGTVRGAEVSAIIRLRNCPRC